MNFTVILISFVFNFFGHNYVVKGEKLENLQAKNILYIFLNICAELLYAVTG